MFNSQIQPAGAVWYLPGGGLGYTDEQIHVHHLSQLMNPIGGLVMLAALGAVLGGLGFVITWRKK